MHHGHTVTNRYRAGRERRLPLPFHMCLLPKYRLWFRCFGFVFVLHFVLITIKSRFRSSIYSIVPKRNCYGKKNVLKPLQVGKKHTHNVFTFYVCLIHSPQRKRESKD